MTDFLSLVLAILAAEASFELIKWSAKFITRPRRQRDARGRFVCAPAHSKRG